MTSILPPSSSSASSLPLSASPSPSPSPSPAPPPAQPSYVHQPHRTVIITRRPRTDGADDAQRKSLTGSNTILLDARSLIQTSDAAMAHRQQVHSNTNTADAPSRLSLAASAPSGHPPPPSRIPTYLHPPIPSVAPVLPTVTVAPPSSSSSSSHHPLSRSSTAVLTRARSMRQSIPPGSSMGLAIHSVPTPGSLSATSTASSSSVTRSSTSMSSSHHLNSSWSSPSASHLTDVTGLSSNRSTPTSHHAPPSLSSSLPASSSSVDFAQAVRGLKAKKLARRHDGTSFNGAIPPHAVDAAACGETHRSFIRRHSGPGGLTQHATNIGSGASTPSTSGPMKMRHSFGSGVTTSTSSSPSPSPGALHTSLSHSPIPPPVLSSAVSPSPSPSPSPLPSHASISASPSSSSSLLARRGIASRARKRLDTTLASTSSHDAALLPLSPQSHDTLHPPHTITSQQYAPTSPSPTPTPPHPSASPASSASLAAAQRVAEHKLRLRKEQIRLDELASHHKKERDLNAQREKDAVYMRRSEVYALNHLKRLYHEEQFEQFMKIVEKKRAAGWSNNTHTATNGFDSEISSI